MVLTFCEESKVDLLCEYNCPIAKNGRRRRQWCAVREERFDIFYVYNVGLVKGESMMSKRSSSRDFDLFAMMYM